MYLEITTPKLPEFQSLASKDGDEVKIETYEEDDDGEEINKNMDDLLELLKKYNIPYKQTEHHIILGSKYFNIKN